MPGLWDGSSREAVVKGGSVAILGGFEERGRLYVYRKSLDVYIATLQALEWNLVAWKERRF